MDINQVDFSNVKTAGEVLNLFVEVARTCPAQSGELFNRYADFIKKSNPGLTDADGRKTAASNIVACGRYFDRYYKTRTVNLLYKTYEGLRQHGTK